MCFLNNSLLIIIINLSTLFTSSSLNNRLQNILKSTCLAVSKLV
nr:MAG TPA: hypothetical protein [Caudoviricetes sp.]